MSDPRSPSVARTDAVVAASAVLGWASSASLSAHIAPEHARLWASTFLAAVLTQPSVVAVEGVVVLVAALALAFGRARLSAEIVLVIALHVAAVVEASARGTAMSSVEPLLPGLVLGARALSRSLARADADAMAHEAACGALAAAFFMAGVAKLALAGPAWVTPASQTLLVYERRESAIAIVSALRTWLVAHPILVSIGAASMLAIEIGAPVFLVPRLRGVWALAAAAAFGALAITLGIVQPTWMALPLVLAFSPTQPRSTPTRSP